MHTTDYVDTFISVAPDCPATTAQAPPEREPATLAQRQLEMLRHAPYEHTSDDVVFASQGEPKGLTREEFFSKGQPCLRSSPLVKRYGWGVHADAEGRVALVPVESGRYRELAADPALTQRSGMRSRRA
ncbi:DUF6157 family protein [Aeromicrobium sp. CF4.19]|uniref:DUF6157 family protein n=1 Tax=Aeromicrobium sp. CF4.19 TaxID=3373082 RepID=UPI003EE692C4